MDLKYDIEIDKENIIKHLNKITNLIFKLLPSREEGGDWETPLRNLMTELAGMDRIMLDHADFFPLICKLESLATLTDDQDFLSFRRTIFECLELMSHIKSCLD
jgi:hypothetical protein